MKKPFKIKRSGIHVLRLNDIRIKSRRCSQSTSVQKYRGLAKIRRGKKIKERLTYWGWFQLR